MSGVSRLLDVARGELGTRETGTNETKYGAAYGMDGNAWCSMYVWWCFRKAGLSGLIPKTAYTPALADWFRARGQWGTSPRPGALVLFDFPNDGVDRISHVGIVEAVNADGSIVSLEGNTSNGLSGSQRDGGGVWRRTRRAGIVGYGYPAFDGAPGIGRGGAADLPTLRRGAKGPAVVALQRFLNAHNWTPDLPLLPPNGQFGPATQGVVSGAQRQCGLMADGVVGPQTNQAFWDRGYRG